MTQQGTIKKLLPNGLAEVEVTRRSACGHDCAKCGGCGGLETQTLYVTARNHAHASVGDRVLLEGETRQVLGFAVLVYLLPLVLFFVGYGVGAGMKLGGGLSALIGGTMRYVSHVFSGAFAFGAYALDAGAANVYTYSLAYNSFVFVDILLVIVAGALLLSSKSFVAETKKFSANAQAEKTVPDGTESAGK